MKNSIAENERRNQARHEIRELRTPQTRMSFLPREQYGDHPELSPQNSVSLPAGPHAGKGSRSYRRLDDSIQDEVCRKITDDPAIDASDVEVFVSEAEVILQGVVQSRLAKRRLDDIVNSVRGIRHVENRVRIRMSGDLRTHTRETFR